MATISNNDIARSIYLGAKDKAGGELSAYLENAVKLLVRRRLMSKAPAILKSMRKLIDIEDGRISAKVSSADPLANQTKHHLIHALMKRYGAKEVILDEVVDPKLLGGFRVEVNDEVLDLSMKNKVDKLQEYLIKN